MALCRGTLARRHRRALDSRTYLNSAQEPRHAGSRRFLFDARCSTVLHDYRRPPSKISLACAATGRGTGAGRWSVRHKHTARPGMSLQLSTIRRDRQAQTQNHGQSQSRWVRKGGRTSVSCRSGRTGNLGPWWDGEELIIQQLLQQRQATAVLVALAEASAFDFPCGLSW